MSSPEYMRAWRAKNRDRIKASWAAWYAENRERLVAGHRTYYQVNRADMLTRHREWAASHAEEVKAYSREYHAANAEERRAKQRAYMKANPDKIKVIQRTSYLAHAAKRRAASMAWAKAHPEEMRARCAARRVRKFGNGGSHTIQERLEKFALLGNVCIYCGEAKPLDEDHNIPLTRGGSDDIMNILPACRSCNSRKYNKTAAEFLAA